MGRLARTAGGQAQPRGSVRRLRQPRCGRAAARDPASVNGALLKGGGGGDMVKVLSGGGGGVGQTAARRSGEPRQQQKRRAGTLILLVRLRGVTFPVRV